MQANIDILQGLHVLLVSEDEQRTQALGKALRERRANVGDLRSSSRDPIALRGADLLVIDTRSAQNTQGRVSEMRADVRARWASVINIDFARVAPDATGALHFGLLENAVAPITASDRALTERARKESSFVTELLPLGPTRILRALGMAGTTLQVEFSAGSDKASLTLSNELLVSCFMDRGGKRWEAWKALARVLGLTDANVTVSRLQHPSAMNIMEPLDQALQTAAQERHAAAAEIASEEPVTTEKAEPEQKPSNPFATPGTTPGPVATLAAKDFKVQPGRTIMGIAPTLARPPQAASAVSPQAVPPKAPPPAPVALPNVAAAKPPAPAAQPPARPMGGSAELGKPGRTIMGIAPGALPALGAFGVRTPGKPEPASAEPAAAPMELASTPAHAPAPSRAAASAVEAKPQLAEAVEEAPKAPLLEGLSLVTPDNSQRELMPTLPAPAPSEAELHFNEQGESRVERIERISLGDTPTDPAPARASKPGEPIELEGDNDETMVTDGAKLEALREEAARMRITAPKLPTTGSTLGDDFQGFADARDPSATRPFDARAMAREAEPEAASKDKGPVNFTRDESQEETITMERPKPAPKSHGRTIALGLLLTVAAGEIGYLAWSRSKQQTEPTAHPAQTAPAAASAHAEAAEAQATKAAAAPEPSVPTAVEPNAAEPMPAEPKATEPEAALPVAAAVVPEAAEPAAEPAVEPTPAAPAKGAAAPAIPDAADPAALEALIKDGTRLLAEKNPDMARPLFEAALARDAKNPHAQAGLGQALYDSGKAAEAIAPFEAAIKLRPKRARYRVQLGDALKAMGKDDQARAAWEKALEIDPNEREAGKRLGK